MQPDGNLVLYRGGNSLSNAYWNTFTQTHPGSYTLLQSNGNMVVKGANSKILYSSINKDIPCLWFNQVWYFVFSSKSFQCNALFSFNIFLKFLKPPLHKLSIFFNSIFWLFAIIIYSLRQNHYFSKRQGSIIDVHLVFYFQKLVQAALVIRSKHGKKYHF